MVAPFKRGTKLIYTCPRHGTKTEVKYVKWMGFERSALIVVQFPDGQRCTVHISSVSEKKDE